MSAMIGMLMLVGIVVTNAVVLLDRVEKNLKSGIPLTEAIVEASKTRLRPILMTACATILALLPLALSESTTSLISGGLAITVIGGLTTSTLLLNRCARDLPDDREEAQVRRAYVLTRKGAGLQEAGTLS